MKPKRINPPFRKSSAEPETILMISQVFAPDPAAVGQYMTDVAYGFVESGLHVRVVTAGRGYDDPTAVYPRRSSTPGMKIRRLAFSSFGKRNLLVRLLAQVSFVVQSTIVGLFARGVSAIFVTTSPPTGGLAAVTIAALRRVPITYWVMDINPEQAIASGKVKSGSVFARMLGFVDRLLLRKAACVITLDDRMADRLRSKADLGEKLVVVPPWPLVADSGATHANHFAEAHNPEGRFVVMYSGNHSIVHPLTTLLEAARRLAEREDVMFLFVGGGLAKREVDDLVKTGVHNVSSLPYQPLDTLDQVLSAADIHVVTMGDNMVGLVHPSKIYGAMAVGRPVLFIGPPHSPLGRLVSDQGIGWEVRHGDVEMAVDVITNLATRPNSELMRAGDRAKRLAEASFGRDLLRTRVIDFAHATFGSTAR